MSEDIYDRYEYGMYDKDSIVEEDDFPESAAEQGFIRGWLAADILDE
ncbi:hypothetical protein HY486_01255 [Candidatus Woesearchaeota archaeon]|nr:hypothetical protein [Candidatus Woesearchaeota archaeon]